MYGDFVTSKNLSISSSVRLFRFVNLYALVFDLSTEKLPAHKAPPVVVQQQGRACWVSRSCDTSSNQRALVIVSCRRCVAKLQPLSGLMEPNSLTRLTLGAWLVLRFVDHARRVSSSGARPDFGKTTMGQWHGARDGGPIERRALARLCCKAAATRVPLVRNASEASQSCGGVLISNSV